MFGVVRQRMHGNPPPLPSACRHPRLGRQKLKSILERFSCFRLQQRCRRRRPTCRATACGASGSASEYTPPCTLPA